MCRPGTLRDFRARHVRRRLRTGDVAQAGAASAPVSAAFATWPPRPDWQPARAVRGPAARGGQRQPSALRDIQAPAAAERMAAGGAAGARPGRHADAGAQGWVQARAGRATAAGGRRGSGRGAAWIWAQGVWDLGTAGRRTAVSNLCMAIVARKAVLDRRTYSKRAPVSRAGASPAAISSAAIIDVAISIDWRPRGREMLRLRGGRDRKAGRDRTAGRDRMAMADSEWQWPIQNGNGR